MGARHCFVAVHLVDGQAVVLIVPTASAAATIRPVTATPLNENSPLMTDGGDSIAIAAPPHVRLITVLS